MEAVKRQRERERGAGSETDRERDGNRERETEREREKYLCDSFVWIYLSDVMVRTEAALGCSLTLRYHLVVNIL